MSAEVVNQGRGSSTTIVDVARAAGVSTATVSRVINGNSKVAQEISIKVHRAIDELGYRPSRAARTLRTQHGQIWALIIPDVRNPHFTEMVRGIEDVAYTAGYSLILCNTDADVAKEDNYLKLALAEHVAGVILAPTNPAPALIDELRERKTSVVTVDRRLSSGLLDGVFVNNAAGAEQAVDHLFAQGYRRLACIAGPLDTTTGRDRLAGFMSALERHQTTIAEPSLVRVGDFREQGGQREMDALLKLAEPPDAVLVANNLMTLGALKAVLAAGLEIPDDVAIVGFDDSSWNSVVHPPLTCIAQPAYDLGAESARLLLTRIDGYKGQPREVMLAPSLRIRASTVAVEDVPDSRRTPAKQRRGVRPTLGTERPRRTSPRSRSSP